MEKNIEILFAQPGGLSRAYLSETSLAVAVSPKRLSILVPRTEHLLPHMTSILP